MKWVGAWVGAWHGAWCDAMLGGWVMTHAWPSLPVNQNPNLTPPTQGPLALHETAAVCFWFLGDSRFWGIDVQIPTSFVGVCFSLTIEHWSL